jgi:hypothetical protein
MNRLLWILLVGCNAVAPVPELEKTPSAKPPSEPEPVHDPEPEPAEPERAAQEPAPEPVEPGPSLTPCWDAYEEYEAGLYAECRYRCLLDHGEVQTRERVACDDTCKAGLDDAQREYERCTTPSDLLAYDECLAEVARQWDFWERCEARCGESHGCAEQYVGARTDADLETYSCEYFHDYAYLLTFVCSAQFGYGDEIENARKWQAYYECRLEYVYELGLDGANCKKPE